MKIRRDTIRHHPQDGWPMPLVFEPHQRYTLRRSVVAYPLHDCSVYGHPRRRKKMTWVQWKRWARERVYDTTFPWQRRDWKRLKSLVPASHHQGTYTFGDDGDWYRGPHIVVDGKVECLSHLYRCEVCKAYTLTTQHESETFAVIGRWCVNCQAPRHGIGEPR